MYEALDSTRTRAQTQPRYDLTGHVVRSKEWVIAVSRHRTVAALMHGASSIKHQPYLKVQPDHLTLHRAVSYRAGLCVLLTLERIT